MKYGLLAAFVIAACLTTSITGGGRAIEPKAPTVTAELGTGLAERYEEIVEPKTEPEIIPVVEAEPEPEPVIDLAWIKDHLDEYYTSEEVRQTTLIVQAEDMLAYSDTVWSAHVWVILGRVGAPGFSHNSSIIDVLSAPNQFSTYTDFYLSKEVVPEVEEIVRDVFARKILEDMGAPEWEVGRTVPATHLFFDNRDGDFYNEFYRYCWGDIYDPFESPYNPYDN